MINFQIVDWDISGKLFLDFINVDIEVQKLVAARDESSVGYTIEQVRNFVFSDSWVLVRYSTLS